MKVEELKKYRPLINQSELCKKAGISRQYMSRVCTGTYDPGKGFVAIIEKFDIKDFIRPGFEEFLDKK